MSLTPVQNFLVPALGTTSAYRLTQTFIAGVPVDIDFRTFALDGRPFAPSGVIIDNTLGVGDIVVVIVEFAYRIVCPAGLSIQVPYPAPMNQIVQVTGEGKATILFVNYPVVPLVPVVVQGSGGGGEPSEPGRSTNMHGFRYALATTGGAEIPPATDTNLYCNSRNFDTDNFVAVPGDTANIVIPAGVTAMRFTVWYGSTAEVSADTDRVAAKVTVYNATGVVNSGCNFPLIANANLSTYDQFTFIARNLVAGMIILIVTNAKATVGYTNARIEGEVLAGDILLT